MSGKEKSKKNYLDFQIEQKTEDELKEMSSKIDDRLFGAQNTKSPIQFVSVGQLLDEAKEYTANWGKMMGLSSGIKAFDHNARGFSKGQLIVIGGETGNGKTALGVNIAVNVAKQGVPVLFITLEITHAEFAARVLKLLTTEQELIDLPLLMQNPDPDADELTWRDVPDVLKEAKKNGVQLIVIDHLHFFSRESSENEARELGRVTKAFKRMAITQEIPVILISHVRKKEGVKVENTNDALRGSSYIAQDADQVHFVTKISSDKVAVKTTKNRRGYDFDHDTVELDFIEGALIRDVTSITDPFEEFKRTPSLMVSVERNAPLEEGSQPTQTSITGGNM